MFCVCYFINRNELTPTKIKASFNQSFPYFCICSLFQSSENLVAVCSILSNSACTNETLALSSMVLWFDCCCWNFSLSASGSLLYFLKNRKRPRLENVRLRDGAVDWGGVGGDWTALVVCSERISTLAGSYPWGNNVSGTINESLSTWGLLEIYNCKFWTKHL